MKDKLESFQGLFDPPARLVVEIRHECGADLGGIYYQSVTGPHYRLAFAVQGWRQGKRKILEVHSPLFDILTAERDDETRHGEPLHGRGPLAYDLKCRPCRETAWSPSPYEVRDLYERVQAEGRGRKGIALFRRNELVALRFK